MGRALRENPVYRPEIGFVGDVSPLRRWLTLHQRWVLPLAGALAGLLLGLSYWFAWGCRNCAKDNSPYGIVGLFVVTTALMTAMWGKDHLRSPPL